jgi:hypothetical protein
VSVLALDRFRRRIIDTEKLLMKQYKLDKSQRFWMIVWGLFLAQLGNPIGSSVYFIPFQMEFSVTYPKHHQVFFSYYLAPYWDNLPVYVEHLLGAHWFGAADTTPLWWETARHDYRTVIIGIAAALIAGAVTVGLKKRKRASIKYMVASVPLAFVLAILVATPLVVFFTWATPFMNNFGLVKGNPYVLNFIGKGAIQLFVIGLVTGLVVRKLVLDRTFDTVQLMSLERKKAEDKTEKRWWKYVYPPNYINRWHYLDACKHEPESHARWFGLALSLCVPFLLFLLVFGIWLQNWGPAAHAH